MIRHTTPYASLTLTPIPKDVRLPTRLVPHITTHYDNGIPLHPELGAHHRSSPKHFTESRLGPHAILQSRFRA
jgi:hypothetical protein